MSNLLASLLDVGHQFSDLSVKTFFCLLLDLGKVTLEVSLLPVLLPFSVQGSLGGNSIRSNKPHKEVKGD